MDFDQAKGELKAALNPRAGERVCIGTPHLDHAGWNYHESLMRMIAYDKAHGDHLMHNSGLMNNGAYTPVWGRGMELSLARNHGAAAFLSSESDWHLWIDSDIGFEQTALEELLAVADPDTAPIVGALCFIEQDYSHDFQGGLRSSLAPTLYDWSWVEPKNGMPGAYQMTTRSTLPEGNPVTRVGATGTGMLLVHRSVYEKISVWLQEEGAPPSIWFDRIPGPGGDLCGEDVSFCLRAHQVGLPILVHTGVRTTHQKTVWWGLNDFRLRPFTPPPTNVLPLPPDQWPKLSINPYAAQQAAAESPIREKQVPEAEEEVAIIVPVARRNNAVPFLDTLAFSLTEAQRARVKVHVLADTSDQETVEAWAHARHLYENMWVYVRNYAEPMGTFAEKVNEGYRVTEEPWLFVVGDDVHFHPGWLDQAMETARSTGKHVIGTNDMGNPTVIAGHHATHMFIRREYVDKSGASWDGPGVVCHEGYRHWFVDNELVAAAKQVSAWAPCLLSEVEHMHPLWAKGADDDVYRIGQEAAEADRERWWARQQIHGDSLVMWGADGMPHRIAQRDKVE